MNVNKLVKYLQCTLSTKEFQVISKRHLKIIWILEKPQSHWKTLICSTALKLKFGP